MADNKKYYYLKVKDNFFDSDAMIILESLPDGYLYSNILLKLYLRSLKEEGKLMFNNRIPYSSTMLAQVTRHSVGVVEKALNIFKELELVEILDNGAIYMSDIQNFIGESSTEADRIRDYRKRIQQEKSIVQMYDKCTPELDIELDLEIEIDKDNVQPDCTEKVSKADIEDFFERIWKLYPNKKGKGQVKDTQKKKLHKVGYKDLEKCIERYKTELKKEDWRSLQNGSTFFNSGYADYLDKNYEPSKATKPSNNKFNNLEPRERDYDEFEKQLLNSNKK